MSTTLQEYFHKHPDQLKYLAQPDSTTLNLTLGSKKTVDWCCHKFNCHYKQSVQSKFRTGTLGSCPICSGRKVIPGVNDFATLHPLTAGEWSKENNSKDPSTLSGKSSFKAVWVCSQCSKKWTASIYNRTNSSYPTGCSSCNHHDSSTPESDKSVLSTHPDIAQLFSPTSNYQPSQVTIGTHKKVTLRLECGHDRTIRLAHYVRDDGSFSMPSCTHLDCCLPEVSIADRMPELEKEYSLKNDKPFSSLSYNSSFIALWECSLGHKWKAAIYQRVNSKTGCPQCSKNGVSKKEQELFDCISSLVDGKYTIEQHNRTVLDGKEIDIFIPELNIGIEFNGLFWHGEAQGKTRNYHRDKYLLAKNKGVQLLTIWEDDWDNRKGIILSMLSHKLELNTQKKIYARKTHIKHLPYHKVQVFLDNYHIQGSVQGSFYTGLYDGDNSLVAVAVWRKNGTDLYLERYATSMTVVGGLGKLLSYVSRHHTQWGVEKIVTFSDNEVSNGGLYEKLGFVLDEELKPDYKYVVGGLKVRKSNYRKKRFSTDPQLYYQSDLSESQLALLNGMDRVWDCGKIRWIKKL